MSGLISNKDMAAIRRTASLMLPDLATVQTSSTASDGAGGQTTIWASTYTNVPCKLAPLLIKNQSSEGEQWHLHSGWVLSVAFDQAIASGNRVVLGGDTYEVLAVEDDHSYRALRRAYLRRID